MTTPDESLPGFPVDDATLLAIEHAMGGALTFDRPDDADLEDEGPWLTGADYSVDKLLSFMSGTLDESGQEYIGVTSTMFGDLPTYVDERPHYTRDDVIRALIGEVRRLRADGEDSE